MLLTISNSDHERRGVGVGIAAAQQTRVVVSNQEASDGERDDVEQQDAPENLLDGLGQFDPRIPRLGGSQTNKFRAGEGEGGCDEDTAETFEAVVESTWFVPRASSEVSSIVTRHAAAVDDDSKDDETDHCDDFDDREDELSFAVSCAIVRTVLFEGLQRV